PLNYNPNTKNVFYSLLVGYFANFAFPRVGEVARCGSLAKSEKIPMESLVGTVIIERAIDFLSLLILVFFIFIAKIDFFGSFLNKYIFLPFYTKLTSIFSSVGYFILIIFAILTLIIIAYYLLKDKISHLAIVKKTIKIMQGVKDGIKTVSKMRNRKVFILHTLFIWLMYFLMTWVIVFSLEATSNLGPIDGLFLLVVGGIGMTMPVQGGIGAFHWITALALTLYNIPRTKGLVYATICHESQTLFIILLG
ncbi:MAG: lysylphosphatidylglycerol synthase transmembrane domain-containing protein, partial [Bacteroidota bacterium]|nr:lysylphosphatidylglycerol synthase transmembrane domain-containing protein [Bacteroidota bacterium]